MTRCAVLKMKRLGVVLVVSLALLVVPGASQADLYLPLVQKTAMYDIDSNLDVRADDQFVHTSTHCNPLIDNAAQAATKSVNTLFGKNNPQMPATAI